MSQQDICRHGKFYFIRGFTHSFSIENVLYADIIFELNAGKYEMPSVD